MTIADQNAAQLDQLLRRYAQLESAAREEAGPLQAELDALQEKVLELNVRLKAIRLPYEAEQAALFEQIKPLAEGLLKDAPKKNWSFRGGTLKYRSGYVRHNWNSDKLLGYAEAHPEIKAFDSPRLVEPVVTIELD